MKFVDQSVTAHPIERLYAWVSVDEETGNEGIIGAELPNVGWLPLVASERGKMEALRSAAEEVAKGTGRPVRLIECVRSRVLEEIGAT